MKYDDSFEESIASLKSRPVAINERGTQAYKHFNDDEQCFSNITKDDFEVYIRAKNYEENIKK